MKSFSRWIAVMLLGFMTFSAFASPSAPVKNVDYQVLSTPQPVDTGTRSKSSNFSAIFVRIAMHSTHL